MFVTDLDGTLFNDTRTISRKNLTALAQARSMGSITAIATGRSLYSFQKAMVSLGDSIRQELPIDYVAFSTGAGVMTFPGEQIIRQHRLEPEEVACISNAFERLELDYMIHRPIPMTNHFLYRCHSRDNPDFFSRIRIYQDYAREMDTAVTVFEPATQLLAVVPPTRPLDFMADLANELEPFSMIQTTSPLDHQSRWIEVFNKEVSKSQAISWLADDLNIDRKNIGAIGNDYNDQDLLTWVQKGYVVANAPHDLKQQFRVMDSNNRDGVAGAVFDFLGGSVSACGAAFHTSSSRS